MCLFLLSMAEINLFWHYSASKSVRDKFRWKKQQKQKVKKTKKYIRNS